MQNLILSSFLAVVIFTPQLATQNAPTVAISQQDIFRLGTSMFL